MAEPSDRQALPQPAAPFPIGHWLASSLVLLLAMWLATGTMAPYALFAGKSPVLKDFPYLVNIDHPQWRALYQLLNGSPSSVWGHSVVLRRILHATVSYPFWRAFGFVPGGILANMILHLAVLGVTACYVHRRWGRWSTIACLWVAATYPGITYWSGLPYAYAFIVPGCLLLMMLLWELWQRVGRGALLACAGLGLVSLGYDFIPLVLPATVILLAWKRRYRLLPAAVACILTPSLLWVLALRLIWGISPTNNNTRVYADIVSSYLAWPDWSLWVGWLKEAPFILVHSFLCSNMVVLPLGFILLLTLRPVFRTRGLAPVETAVLISIAGLFLVINLAPPHSGWGMRGYKFARLYQPLAIVFVSYIVRQFAAEHRPLKATVLSPWRARLALLALLALLNSTISFGPILRNPVAGYLYQDFYGCRHDFTMNDRLDTLGRRPLGF